MDACIQMQEAISRLLDGELSAEEETAVRAHIAACPDCRALYEAFSAVSDELQSDLAESPETLRENVMATLRREAMLKRNRRTWRVLLSAAAVAALVLGLRFGLQGLHSEDSLGAAVRLREAAPVAESIEAEESAADAAMTSAAGAAVADDAVTLDSLLAYLAGEPLDASLPDGEPLATLALPDGALALYERDGALCYREPGSGTLLQTARSLAEIEAFLKN